MSCITRNNKDQITGVVLNNGQDSKLFDDLLKIHQNGTIAYNIYQQILSPAFQSIKHEYELDSNGEPILKNKYTTSNNIESYLVKPNITIQSEITKPTETQLTPEKTLNQNNSNNQSSQIYSQAVKEANARPNNTLIPQNLQSGVEQYGTLQEANNDAKKLLGANPYSIDMIDAGIRTRTTRTDAELQKYNIKEGSYTYMFGKSANGSTKKILVKITKITKGVNPESWYKEGWTGEGIKKLSRFNTANAVEFEKVEQIYSQLGNKTVSENVESLWAQNKESIQSKFPDLTEEQFNSMTEQEKTKFIKCYL